MKENITQNHFYLASIDILQGISIIYFVTWHTMLWWDHSIDSRWPNVLLPTYLFMTTAMCIPPLFFCLYGFNVANSLMRKRTEIERHDSRTRLLKRTVIFFVIAEFCEGITALVTNPGYLLNYLFTWELFHLFSLSTIFLLLVFEFAWKLEEQEGYNYRKIGGSVLIFFLIFIIAIFLIIHDYTSSTRIESMHVELALDSILKRMLFEYGQNPVIPWLSFPIIGGITAIFLNLTNEERSVALKKTLLAFLGGFTPLILGILFLGIERYISNPVYYPASSSFLFIAIGTVILLTTSLILIIDLNLKNSQIMIKIFKPLILISKISLTVFIIHYGVYIIPPEFILFTILISSEIAAMILGFLYSLTFVLIAFIWQKWHYMYSLEWTISKLQTTPWRWWLDRSV
ncbi:MAG: acyltransferase family protein [Candidatus Hodarchaeota archaeon]